MAFYVHDNTSFEVIYFNESECQEMNENENLSYAKGDTEYEPGYYYWYSLPGCYPDSEPFGPYETHEAAHDAAIEQLSY